MYTEDKNNNISTIYLNLVKDNNTYMDYDKLVDFLCLLSTKQIKIILPYNCLYYPHIYDLLDKLNFYFYDYELRIQDINCLKTFEKYNGYVNDIFCKLDVNLSDEVKHSNLNDNYLLYKRFLNLKKNYSNFIFDLYLNDDNIVILKNTLKFLSGSGCYSRILFYEYLKSENYDMLFYDKCVCKKCYEQQLLLDDVLSDNKLLIYNRDYILNTYYNIMNLKCNLDSCCSFLCLNYDFKFMLCDKIVRGFDVDVFDCFDENGNLKQSFVDMVSDYYKRYCFGCNCDNFMNKENFKRVST